LISSPTGSISSPNSLGDWSSTISSKTVTPPQKHWSVIYRENVTPQLSPAYDLVSTIYHVQNDSLALNLGEERRFESIDESNFNRVACRMSASQQFVLDIVKETVTAA
jgi:hypothetical protein